MFDDLQLLVRAVRNVSTLTDLGLVMTDATRLLGFDHYAVVQTGAASPLGRLQLSDFPDQWVNHLALSGLIAHDPVLLACERSSTPFAWSNLSALVPMTRHHHDYMARAREAGLAEGYTVPIHMPGHLSGLVSFAVADPDRLPGRSLPGAHYLASFAFEAARRLAQDGAQRAAEGPANSARPRLTQRQIDCLVLSARGKSNWVAGQLLGLSSGTVHKYLEAAKQRYGVSSRTELVVRALFDGQISFADVMGDSRPSH